MSFQDRPYRSYIKDQHLHLTPHEILQSSPLIIISVDSRLAALLEHFHVYSVFDLATLPFFNNALKIAEAKEDSESIYTLFGSAAREMISDGKVEASLEALQELDIIHLDGVGVDTVTQLKEITGIEIIRDLAFWPVFQAARFILQYTFNVDNIREEDPDAPADLVPRARSYAVEKRYFQRVFIDDNPTFGGMIDLIGRKIDPFNTNRNAFGKPVMGKMLHYEQTWTPHSVSLGNLVHSLALAPGESTRIAIVEWERREAARLAESLDQKEQLANNLSQKSALEEVFDGTVSEFQEGQSETGMNAQTRSHSYAGGGGFFGSGSSITRTTTTSSSNGFSIASSKGRRDITNNTQQQLARTTRQVAAGVRAKRVSVVKEVEQTEREQVQTRVVTNYNHSHPLSVHYYEVVQIYRTEVQAVKAEPVLFVPIQGLDMKDTNSPVFKHFKKAVLNSAIDEGIKKTLETSMSSIKGININARQGDNETHYFSKSAKLQRIDFKLLGNYSNSYLRINWVEILMKDGKNIKLEAPPFDAAAHEEYKQTHHLYLWLGDENSASFRILHIDSGIILRLSVIEGTPKISFENINRPVADIAGINIQIEKENDNPFLHDTIYKLNGDRGSILVKNRIRNFQASGDKFVQTYNLISFSNDHSTTIEDAGIESLVKESIIMSLSPGQWARILSKYAYKQQPLLNVIELPALGVYGNYAIFKYTQTNDEWEQWLDEDFRKVKKTEDLVSIPSNGVFAEAVLGTANASEKIDVTRFWDWQEAPIPEPPGPKITPITVSSRGSDDQTSTTGLSAPIVNIQKGQAFPELQLLKAMAQALGNPNTFRDMSFINETIAAAVKASEYTSKLGNETSKANVDLMKTRMKLFNDMAKFLLGKDENTGSATRIGGLLNFMTESFGLDDTQALAAAMSGAAAAGAAGGGTGNSNTGGDSGGGGNGSSGGGSSSGGETNSGGGDGADASANSSDSGPDGTWLVRYNVTLVPQPNKTSCWAAAMAMLYSYYHKPIDANTLIENLGFSLEASYGWDVLLDVKSFYGFINIPLTVESETPSVEQIQDWLTNHGPLLFTVDGNPSHAVVVAGIKRDASDVIWLHVFNPWDTREDFDDDPTQFNPENKGYAYFEKYEDFIQDFTRLSNKNNINYDKWRIIYLDKKSSAFLFITDEDRQKGLIPASDTMPPGQDVSDSCKNGPSYWKAIEFAKEIAKRDNSFLKDTTQKFSYYAKKENRMNEKVLYCGESVAIAILEEPKVVDFLFKKHGIGQLLVRTKTYQNLHDKLWINQTDFKKFDPYITAIAGQIDFISRNQKAFCGDIMIFTYDNVRNTAHTHVCLISSDPVKEMIVGPKSQEEYMTMQVMSTNATQANKFGECKYYLQKDDSGERWALMYKEYFAGVDPATGETFFDVMKPMYGEYVFWGILRIKYNKIMDSYIPNP
ncbi:MAG: papain-like cysteine protease family protein [Flammeovirgaceae bacterium]